ncbi:MAG: DMT family transporter, partial [Actinomycetota bacterium]
MALGVGGVKQGRADSHGRLGVTAAGIAVVLWALSNVLVKQAHTSAFVFAFWRLWLGAAGLWLAGMVTGRPLTRRVLVAVWPAGLMFAVNLVASFSALRLTTVANVSLIGALQPALVLTVAGRLFGEVATRWKIAWTGVSVAGVVAVLLGSPRGPEFRPVGDLLAVVGLVIWVGFLVAAKRARATIPAFQFMTGVLLIAA